MKKNLSAHNPHFTHAFINEFIYLYKRKKHFLAKSKSSSFLLTDPLSKTMWLAWQFDFLFIFQRDFPNGGVNGGHISNGHCSNGLVIGGQDKKISLPRQGSRREKRQQQQQQLQNQQQKKFFTAKFSEHERGISLEFGKFVALISISGKCM